MRVRKITPADEAAYASILGRTSDEDRYYRFFKAVDLLSGAEVQAAVDDRPDMVAFIAEDVDAASVVRPLGAAHAALIDERTAELAIIVAADARRNGVARQLLVTLVTYLRKRGFDRIIAHSLQENAGFARLATSIGLHIESVAGAAIRWSLEPVREPALI